MSSQSAFYGVGQMLNQIEVEGDVIAVSDAFKDMHPALQHLFTEDLVTYRWTCPADNEGEPICGIGYHEDHAVLTKGFLETTVDAICPCPPRRQIRVHLVFVERIKQRIAELQASAKT